MVDRNDGDQRSIGLAVLKVLPLIGMEAPEHGVPQSPKTASYILPKLAGHRPLSVCSQSLLHCWHRATNHTSRSDAHYYSIQQCFVGSGQTFHNRSMIVRAEELQMARATLEAKLLRLASAHHAFSRLEWSLAQQYLKASLPVTSLVLFVEYMAYDETPMKTKVLDPLLPDLPVWEDPTAPRRGAAQSLAVTNSSPTTKILQCQHFCALLLRIGDRYVKIYGEIAAPLQVMEKNNSVVLAECLGRLSAATPTAHAFNMQTRMVSRDQAGYNKKAERGILQGRASGSWSGLEFDCEIHSTARAFQKTYDELLEADVSGILNVALCLRSGSNMMLFRRCLLAECRAKLKILRGSIPQEALQYRSTFLRQFVSTGANVLLNRLLLCRLPNGLWSDTSVIQIYIPHSQAEPVNVRALANVITSSLCYVLTGSKPHLFARHRWTGCDLAVEELGRLEGIHGLLSSTWERFMVAHSTPSLQVSDGPACSGLGEEADEVPESVWQPANTALGTQPVDDREASADQGLEFVVSSSDAEKHRSPAQHARDRRKAAEWLSAKPFATLVLFRVTMAPLVSLLNAQLGLSSMEWDRKESGKQADQWASGGPIPKRHYMVTMAAQQILERKYFVSLRQLFHEEAEWQLIKEEKHTVEFRALAFRILSRQGALIHLDLQVPHGLPPFSLFSVLHTPELAESVVGTPPCMLDEWSQAVIQKYPTLSGEECLQFLETHAAIAATNTAPIESRHSSLRRQLVGRSLQTWPMAFPVLSAEFLLQGCRRHRLRHTYSVETSATPAPSATNVRKRKAADVAQQEQAHQTDSPTIMSSTKAHKHHSPNQCEILLAFSVEFLSNPLFLFCLPSLFHSSQLRGCSSGVC